MKKRCLLTTLLFLLIFIVVKTNGQQIIIVSDTETAVQTYADELTNAGYSVTIKIDLNVELSSDQIDELQAADLILFSRNTNSANFNFPDIWNSIETPILMTSCFMTRNNRLKWFDIAEVNEKDGVEITIMDETHRIFQNIDVSSGLLPVNNTVLLHTNPVADAGNGTVLATSSTTGNVVIAEWPIGTEFYEGSGYFAAESRFVFFMGLSSDFTEQGKILFLNVIDYMLNPEEDVYVDDKFNEKLRIYPLPVANNLKIEGDLSANTNFQILTLTGQVVMSSILKENCEIDLSNCRSGAYVLVLNDGNQRIVRRIIKN